MADGAFFCGSDVYLVQPIWILHDGSLTLHVLCDKLLCINEKKRSRHELDIVNGCSIDQRSPLKSRTHMRKAFYGIERVAERTVG